MEESEAQEVKALVARLKKRVAGREHAIEALRNGEDVAGDPPESEAVHQAHIDELEYMLDDLEQIFPESR